MYYYTYRIENGDINIHSIIYKNIDYVTIFENMDDCKKYVDYLNSKCEFGFGSCNTEYIKDIENYCIVTWDDKVNYFKYKFNSNKQ